MQHRILPIIVNVISYLAPADIKHYSYQETVAETNTRYESIASDLVEVVFDKDEKPIYTGDDARVRTLSVMLAIDSFESGFHKDVDQGFGKFSKGDHGASWCLGQINLGGQRVHVKEDGTIEYGTGWSGQDLVQDRKKCFRVQLAILRSSFACPTSVEDGKLSLYASGDCSKGFTASQNRMKLARKLQSKFFQVTDIEALQEPVLADEDY